MNLQKSISLFFSLLSLLGFCACAPEVTHKEFVEPKQEYTPRNSDTDLAEKYRHQEIFDFDKATTLEGAQPVAQVLRMCDNLFSLSQLNGDPRLATAGFRVLQKLQSLKGVREQVPLSQTPYVQLALSATEVAAVSEITVADQKISRSAATITSLISQVASEYSWPTGPQKLRLAAAAIEGFLAQLTQKIKKASIYGPMQFQVVAELGNRQKWVRDLGEKIAHEFETITQFPELINLLNQTLHDEKIELAKDVQDTLSQGQVIAKDMQVCTSAQGALSVIVDIWNLLDDKQRKAYIQPVNADLYKLLQGKGERDLQCLKQTDCTGIIRNLIKQQFILPKLEVYGVAKLCRELNDKSLQFAVSHIEEMVPNLYATIPTITQQAFDKVLAEKRQQIARVRDHYQDFFTERIQIWGKNNLPGKGQVASLVTGTVNISLEQRRLGMSPPSSATGSSEALGLSLTLDALMLSLSSEAKVAQQVGVEAVNKLVASVGYRNPNKELVPAWAVPLEAQSPFLDINQFASGKDGYAVSDQFSLKKGFQLQDPRPEKLNISAHSQAELLSGASHMIGFFSDWKQTPYEKTLGLVMAQALVPEFETPELQQAVFPKSSLLALSVANAAVILKNITQKNSPFFMVTLDGRNIWVNDYDFNRSDAAVMVGMVDIQEGKRTNVVKSEDISRWILATSEFLQATEGIENTKSHQLLSKKEGEGSRPLDTLMDARRQLRLLLIGMCNFLSNQLVNRDGLVAHSVQLSNIPFRRAAEDTVLDQVLALRALTQAARITKVDIYQTTAIEIYYRMNERLYSPHTHLYSMVIDSAPVPLPLALEIVRALTELRPHLPEISQRQLSMILDPWYEALQTLN